MFSFSFQNIFDCTYRLRLDLELKHILTELTSERLLIICTSVQYKLNLNKNAHIKAVFMDPLKGELIPKIDFLWFEHLGIVEQLYEVFLSC